MSVVVPTATTRSPRIARASAHGRVESAVKIFPPTRMRSGGAAGLCDASDRESNEDAMPSVMIHFASMATPSLGLNRR